MVDFIDKLGQALLPRPVRGEGTQEVSVKLPVGAAQLNGDFSSSNIDHGTYWFDPNIVYHDKRAENVRGLVEPVLELPLALLQRYVRNGTDLDENLPYAFSVGALGVATFIIGCNTYPIIQHEFGHLSGVYASGTKKAFISYNLFGDPKKAPTAAVNIDPSVFEKISNDYQLLTDGAGLAANSQAFQAVLEDGILTGNTLSIPDIYFLALAYFANIKGYGADAPQNYWRLHPDQTPTSSYGTWIGAINLVRPYGMPSLLGAVGAGIFADSFILPDIIPDLNADFGPLGILYSFRAYARLDEHTVIKPEIRFSTDRPSVTAGFSYFSTGNEGDLRFKLGGELWYQPHFDGLGAAFGAQVIMPIIDGVELDLDARYKTYGYTPDAATLGQSFSGYLNLNISDKVF